MAGHVQQVGDDGKWRVWWDVTPDPVTGRRRRRTVTVYGARAAAEAELAARVADVDAGVVDADGRTTVRSFAALWLEARRVQVRATTLAGYEAKVAHTVRFVGHRPMGKITGGVLTAMYGRLLDEGLSSRSVRHVHMVTRRMFADACRWGYLKVNPADVADVPAVSSPEMATWTAPQVAKFLAETRRSRWWPVWLLAATTGMRRGEICGLRWQDVDLDAGVLHVRQTVVTVNGQARRSTPKTAAGRRKIALDPATVAHLRKLKTRQLEERLAMGSDWAGEDLVVCWPDGALVNPNIVTRSFVRAARLAGLPRIRFHDLRHTWATLALEAGIPDKVVADRLGHSSVVVTLDTYTHVPDQTARTAAERVAGMLGI